MHKIVVYDLISVLTGLCPNVRPYQTFLIVSSRSENELRFRKVNELTPSKSIIEVRLVYWYIYFVPFCTFIKISIFFECYNDKFST